MGKLYGCDMCHRLTRVVVGSFSLDVPTWPSGPDDLGVKRYPSFESGGHAWRVEEDTAEIRVWNSLPDPIVVVEFDGSAIIRGKTCPQCCVDVYGFDPREQGTPSKVPEDPDKEGRWQKFCEEARARKEREKSFARAAHQTHPRGPRPRK